MITRFAILILFTCAYVNVNAQVNYVLNPGFEQYLYCPDFYDQIGYAKNWSGIDTNWTISDSVTPIAWCMPEYCNTCASGTFVGVPHGENYYHFPRSGNGMAEVRMLIDLCCNPLDYRDYLQGRLSALLTAGKSYCVSFYVTLAQGSGDAIDHIGAYLDDGSIDQGQDSLGCSSPQTRYIPQVYSNTIIKDTLNWTVIHGNFIANGTEKFITIGNFFDYAHTSKLFLSSPGISFYLIDDVSVLESDLVANAGHDTTIAYGDSVYIGTKEQGLPCTWYKAGSSIAVGYSGGIWVKPDTTTKYIVEMDLCGNVTYDAVTVYVMPEGLSNIKQNGSQQYSLFPNPSNGNIILQQAIADELPVKAEIFNGVGLNINKDNLHFTGGVGQLHMINVTQGLYLIHLVDSKEREFIIKFVVK